MPARPAPAVRRFPEVARRGYTVERLLIETLPGLNIGVNVYRPARPRGKSPGVLVAHGHWKHGRVEHNDAYSVPALCAALAVNGYVALAYDMPGYNDSTALPHKFGDGDAERQWSFGPLQVQLWNSLRMVDYLAARPDVDASRLAITGASGGGTQTYLLAAVDDRIKVSIPAGMVSSTFQGDDPCEMAPGLRIGTNNMELAAAFAPRPQLLLSTSRDWTSLTPTVELPGIRSIYSLLGAAGNLENHHADAEHGYNAAQRAAAVAFLARHFRMPPPVPEPAGETYPAADLLIGAKDPQNQEAIFLAWQRLLSERNRAMTAPQQTELLRHLTGGRWPKLVVFVAAKGEGFLHREGAGDIVPAHRVAGRMAGAAVAVHPGGAAAALQSEAARATIRAGVQVVGIDVFETASAATQPRSRHGDHLVFHHADDANRVQDVLTAASWLSAQGATGIRLLCAEKAAEWCHLAARLAPVPLKVVVEGPSRQQLQIPGLAAAGYSAPGN